MRKVSSMEFIKSINRSLILETIRNEQPISRADLARKLGLSRSTVSSLVEELLAKKFVIELGLGGSTKEGGRRGIELGFNPRSAFGIGVEIRDHGLLLLVTDLEGTIVADQTFDSMNDVHEMIGVIQSFLEQFPVDTNLILGMGIAVPSVVDIEGMIVDAPSLGWQNVDLKKELERSFTFPIFINNDVDCAAMGERWLGTGSLTNHMFYLSIGTGVGGAIIANGQLIRGHQYSAGEIGYFIDKEDICKQEAYQSGQFGMFESKMSSLLEAYQASKDTPDPLIMFLSIAIANIVSLLNPEKVIIGGAAGCLLTDFINEIREKVSAYSPLKTNIELARLGDNAGALGAVMYAFEQIREMNSVG